jgi:ADP-ribosyl-[dinitrogen reductase] hydrolase
MALCLADSLQAHPGFDPRDLMSRFVEWWQEGRNSVTGRCFDIGLTTRAALRRFMDSNDPHAGDPSRESAGNGSLMRLAPAAIRAHRDPDLAASLAVAQSRTTHPAPQCLDACAVFSRMLVAAIAGAPKQEVLALAALARDEDLAEIRHLGWRSKDREQISSSGYVVDTLEAALWAVDRSDSFDQAILLAANLGDDADTVAAVTGQLAGALWGVKAIPAGWLQLLWWSPRLRTAASSLYSLGLQG